jgi:hypothetical protein
MYKDPVISEYIALIKAKAAGKIETFFQGDPITVPMVNLPACIITKRETHVGHHTNAEDEQAIGLSITVIVNVRKELSTEESRSQVAAEVAKLYDLVEGRNGDFKLKDTSVLGILRHNPLVNSTYGLRTDLGSVTRVDYGQTLRDRAPEAWTIEARIDMVAYFTQVR